MAKKILVKDFSYMNDELSKETKSYLEVNGSSEIDNPEEAIADYIIRKRDDINRNLRSNKDMELSLDIFASDDEIRESVGKGKALPVLQFNKNEYEAKGETIKEYEFDLRFMPDKENQYVLVYNAYYGQYMYMHTLKIEDVEG